MKNLILFTVFAHFFSNVYNDNFSMDPDDSSTEPSVTTQTIPPKSNGFVAGISKADIGLYAGLTGFIILTLIGWTGIIVVSCELKKKAQKVHRPLLTPLPNEKQSEKRKGRKMPTKKKTSNEEAEKPQKQSGEAETPAKQSGEVMKSTKVKSKPIDYIL